LSIDVVAGSEMALVDVLDRLLADGVVVSGDLTLAIADVDLVHLSLRTLITSITGEEEQ
jgi:Gas vesicle protein